jgi:GDP-L-fucose synthase
MNKKKILITGASGFVGTNLCKLISKSKYNLFATYFKKKKFVRFKKITYLKKDLTIFKNCIEMTKNMNTVIMCAANSSGANVIVNNPLAHFTPNVIMNTNMLQACYQNNVKKFIFISSNTVYPNTKKIMTEKDSKYNFFSKYYTVAWMKKFSEISCEIFSKKINSNLSCIIIRPANLYGPFDKFTSNEAKVIPALIRRAIEKDNPFEVWGDGNDLKDFLYIDDFIESILKLINYETKFDIFNICFGKSISIRKILDYILKISRLRTVVNYDSKKPTLIRNRFINNSKALKKLNWKPKTSHEEGLKKTIEWYKKYYKNIKPENFDDPY